MQSSYRKFFLSMILVSATSSFEIRLTLYRSSSRMGSAKRSCSIICLAPTLPGRMRLEMQLLISDR
jgi:hypothetical protein